MTAPQGVPGSGGTAAAPTPARPWIVVIDGKGTEYRTALGAVDAFLNSGKVSCEIITPCSPIYRELDALPVLELPHRGQQ